MKQVGEKSEAIVLAELIKMDIPVSIPFGDNQRYDMIIDLNDNLYKIQVKTSRYKNGAIRFATSSSSYHRGGKRTNYKGDIDFFIVCCYETNSLYMVDINKSPNTEMYLRVEEPKGRKLKDINWAKDYEINKVINKLIKS